MLFEVAVLKKEEDKKLETMVVDVTSVVARDAKAAERIAIKMIPEGMDLNDAVVIVRPFV